MAKIVNAPTLDEVNSNLLCRLNALIDQADGDELLRLTEVVAKLNASWKNNDQFGRPESEEERKDREQREIFGSVLEGDVQ